MEEPIRGVKVDPQSKEVEGVFSLSLAICCGSIAGMTFFYLFIKLLAALNII